MRLSRSSCPCWGPPTREELQPCEQNYPLHKTGFSEVADCVFIEKWRDFKVNLLGWGRWLSESLRKQRAEVKSNSHRAVSPSRPRLWVMNLYVALAVLLHYTPSGYIINFLQFDQLLAAHSLTPRAHSIYFVLYRERYKRPLSHRANSCRHLPESTAAVKSSHKPVSFLLRQFSLAQGHNNGVTLFFLLL